MTNAKDKPAQSDEEFFQEATEKFARNLVELAESGGEPLSDASFTMLEQAAAEAAKEGRGHVLAELARRAKALQQKVSAVPDDEDG
jgi:hypothetical protein